jgi:hypothetical protein
MKVFQEITEWDTEFRMPNHVYFLSDSKDKMYAYVNKAGVVETVRTPYKFKASGRKFKEVPNTWGYEVAEEKPQGRTWQVAGSKGNQYTVNEHLGSWNCTCTGFKFHGECKHIKELSGS